MVLFAQDYWKGEYDSEEIDREVQQASRIAHLSGRKGKITQKQLPDELREMPTFTPYVNEARLELQEARRIAHKILHYNNLPAKSLNATTSDGWDGIDDEPWYVAGTETVFIPPCDAFDVLEHDM